MAALMLEWIALAACRTGEARFATWGEIDTETKLWSIPAQRMKMKKAHVVPITNRMAQILEEAKRRNPVSVGKAGLQPDDLVFVSGDGKPLSDMACVMLMRGMDKYKDCKPHGLRSSFKDWVSEKTDFAWELSEEQLAHKFGKVERAYKRGSTHDRRRPMMEAWAAVCDGAVPAEGAEMSSHCARWAEAGGRHDDGRQGRRSICSDPVRRSRTCRTRRAA
jgi:integrase